MLDWQAFDPDRFERAVQILLREQFGAVAIDGAGGDQAHDSRLATPDGLDVFEVKSFSKRLATSQKRQIKKFLDRAVLLHKPRRWVLITRSNPSAQDKRWLETQDHPGTVVDWFGVDWLDGSIAGREDLISYLEGPDYKLLRRAAELGLETAAAADGASLVERLQTLNSRSHDITPHWRWDANVTGDGLLMTLRAKTPDAATTDPIMLKPTFAFPPDDPVAAGYQDALDRALRFGGDVEIPHPYLVDFAIETSSDATAASSVRAANQVGSGSSASATRPNCRYSSPDQRHAVRNEQPASDRDDVPGRRQRRLDPPRPRHNARSRRCHADAARSDRSREPDADDAAGHWQVRAPGQFDTRLDGQSRRT